MRIIVVSLEYYRARHFKMEAVTAIKTDIKGILFVGDMPVIDHVANADVETVLELRLDQYSRHGGVEVEALLTDLNDLNAPIVVLRADTISRHELFDFVVHRWRRLSFWKEPSPSVMLLVCPGHYAPEIADVLARLDREIGEQSAAVGTARRSAELMILRGTLTRTLGAGLPARIVRKFGHNFMGLLRRVVK